MMAKIPILSPRTRQPENQDALNSLNLKEFEIYFEMRNVFPFPASISIYSEWLKLL